MSIPKRIHYCWFGRNPKPKLAERCIKSWKKYCPDYEIVEWNEDNFDISACPLYVRQAYEAKKWAFVTDYVRLKVVFEHGGVYMDTDVELKKPLDSLLDYQGYFGFEDSVHICTGVGFGAVKGAPILFELMQSYTDIPFIREDGSQDILPCPQRDAPVFRRHGLKEDGSRQILQDNILVLPATCLCPISYMDGKKQITESTISVHWFSASWHTQAERDQHKANIRKAKKARHIDELLHLPNRLLRMILGEKRYEALKRRIKRNQKNER